MIRRHYPKYLLILLLFPAACRESDQDSSNRQQPNIIVILADDMGYSDLGCMGSEIHTPHLDRLAQEGLLFTQCYNTARCCPSRASLLTGLYPHRAGVGHMSHDFGIPAYQGYLNDHSVTIAEVMKTHGYHTMMSGKWHVGGKREHWPDRRGFEQFYGIPNGGGLYFYPSEFVDRPIYRNGKEVKPDSATFYSTDDFTDEAIGFIREMYGGGASSPDGASRAGKKPFFLYLAYIAPHFPLQAWPEDIARYKDVYNKGYEAVRQKRFERQKASGIIGAGAKLSPPDHLPWDSLKDQQQEARKMAVYAAQVDRMDQNIGRLLKALKEMGLYENTVILFLSDNGASSEEISRSSGAKIGTASSFVSYGKGWANVSNTPYRFYKKMTHEGGILTPLIVHWPSGMAQIGKQIREPVHLKDIMPTCLELAGATYPEQFNGKAIQALDGKSFAPLIKKGKKRPDSAVLYWEHEGNKAVRKGDWKLVKRRQTHWELYHLGDDPTELEDLSTQQPALADSLKKDWNNWAGQSGVLPWPISPAR